MDLLNEVVKYLNANVPVMVVLTGVIVVAVQYLINRFATVSKLTNYLLALVALPGVSVALASLGTTLNLSAYPWVAVVGQILYAVYEKIKRNAAAAAVKPEPVFAPDPVAAEVIV